jgi:hydrogenase maturation factor
VISPQPNLRTGAGEPCDPETGCITCGDVAVPLRVTALDLERELALCSDDDGRRETVEIALVAPVAVGDELLVHAGTAIARSSRGR